MSRIYLTGITLRSKLLILYTLDKYKKHKPICSSFFFRQLCLCVCATKKKQCYVQTSADTIYVLVCTFIYKRIYYKHDVKHTHTSPEYIKAFTHKNLQKNRKAFTLLKQTFITVMVWRTRGKKWKAVASISTHFVYKYIHNISFTPIFIEK